MIDEVDELEKSHDAGFVHLQDIPEYGIYHGIKQRCYNPNCTVWKWYGGRGIHMCDKWLEGFWNFFRDVGCRPNDGGFWSIDRINNDGHYEPGNVRWATAYEQAWNRKNGIPGNLNGAKLNWELAREIRALRGIASRNTVANDFGISETAVGMIWNNKAWMEEGISAYDRRAYLTGETNPNATITNDQAAEIKWWTGDKKLSCQAIANFYGINRSVVSRIRLGQSWEHIEPKAPKFPKTAGWRRM